MKLVLAKSHLRFQQWVVKNGFDPKQYQYIGRRNDLIGYRFSPEDILYVPGFQRNPEYNQDFWDAFEACCGDRREPDREYKECYIPDSSGVWRGVDTGISWSVIYDDFNHCYLACEVGRNDFRTTDYMPTDYYVKVEIPEVKRPEPKRIFYCVGWHGEFRSVPYKTFEDAQKALVASDIAIISYAVKLGNAGKWSIVPKSLSYEA